MQLRTFRGPNIVTTMTQIRTELGPDAIIIDTQTDRDGVAITAAINGQRSTRSSYPGAIIHPDDTYRAPGKGSTKILDNVVVERIARCLEHHQVPEHLVEQIFAAMVNPEHEDGESSALAEALATVLRFQPLNFAAQPVSRLMVVGPPGGGKTTMLAKLLATALVEGYRPRVICCDSVRAGAVQQLHVFTEAMGLPLTMCRTPVDLQRCLAEYANSPLIFIDAPGINPFDPQEARLLAEFVLVLKHAPFLVLPAGIDVMEAADLAEVFHQLGATRMLTTRLDVAKRYGGILTAAHNASLALAAFSDTPFVSKPLLAPRPTMFAKILLKNIAHREDRRVTWHEEYSTAGRYQRVSGG